MLAGDYRRSGAPRLVLEFSNGAITIWSASLRFLDGRDAREQYDFTSDVLSDSWDPRAGAIARQDTPAFRVRAQ